MGTGRSRRPCNWLHITGIGCFALTASSDALEVGVNVAAGWLDFGGALERACGRALRRACGSWEVGAELAGHVLGAGVALRVVRVRVRVLDIRGRVLDRRVCGG
jgi:hypothetical protein